MTSKFPFQFSPNTPSRLTVGLYTFTASVSRGVRTNFIEFRHSIIKTAKKHLKTHRVCIRRPARCLRGCLFVLAWVRAGARGTKKNSENAWSALEFDKKTKKFCFFVRVRAWPPTTTLSPVLVRGLATSLSTYLPQIGYCRLLAIQGPPLLQIKPADVLGHHLDLPLAFPFPFDFGLPWRRSGPTAGPAASFFVSCCSFQPPLPPCHCG